MERKKVTIKGVDKEAWELVQALRENEQRMIGAIITDAIYCYAESDDNCIEDR